MKLGILANTNRHMDHIVGITRAACARGHEVSIFAMDEGTEIVVGSEFRKLCKCDNVIISICRHSAESRGVDTSTLSKEIISGSQFNNAVMNNEADKIIIL
jgi:predicted peroxiredoxin